MTEVIILDDEKHQVVLTDIEDATLVCRILKEALLDEPENSRLDKAEPCILDTKQKR